MIQPKRARKIVALSITPEGISEERYYPYQCVPCERANVACEHEEPDSQFIGIAKWE